MTYDVRVESIATPRPLAVVRRRASARQLSQVIPATCGLVWNDLKARNVTGAGRHIAVYLDDQINVEVGVELDGPLVGDGEADTSSLPTGRVATTTHFGPYAKLCDAHQAIRNWAAANGATLAGPSWEIYGHWQQSWDGEESKIRTDVCYLLR